MNDSTPPSDVKPSRPDHTTVFTRVAAAMLVVGVLGGVVAVSGANRSSDLTADVETQPIRSTVTAAATAGPTTSTAITVDAVTTAPPTAPAPTTTSTSTTTTTTTTTTSTTTTLLLPQPIDPPTDVRGPEEQVLLGGISIPKLGVDAPLLEGIRLTTLDQGPGHWPGSAMPGDVGNVVVAGHRTSHGAQFRDIDQLVAGDTVLFDTETGQIEYSVTGTQIVNPEDIWIVNPTETPTATLFACHPLGSTRQRIVVNLELSS